MDKPQVTFAGFAHASPAEPRHYLVVSNDRIDYAGSSLQAAVLANIVVWQQAAFYQLLARLQLGDEVALSDTISIYRLSGKLVLSNEES